MEVLTRFLSLVLCFFFFLAAELLVLVLVTVSVSLMSSSLATDRRSSKSSAGKEGFSVKLLPTEKFGIIHFK